MQLGIERFLEEETLRRELYGRRIALVAHPASVDRNLFHSLDLLAMRKDLKLFSAFSPQHGMRGEKQDNMVESHSYNDPHYNIPIFSLYGDVRRPTSDMLSSFDVLLFDLQDLGCRIYTFVTTLLYLMEASAEHQKSIWILDRPNPVGRGFDGTTLRPGYESFVGAAPMPIRHGMTVGELALWYQKKFNFDLDLRVIPMAGYDPTCGPGYGWPLGERTWVNPSPNAPNLSMARCFPGSVMLEGTNLSEGRGTTRPLEVVGHPEVDMARVLKTMHKLKEDWLAGCRIRECYFEPTFHKHQGKLCHGLQIHVDDEYYVHEVFRPYRLFALFFKALRQSYPDFEIWRDFHYEYEKDRLAIDLITGSSILREWVDEPHGQIGDFEEVIDSDLGLWQGELEEVALYSI